ncbi:MAG: hypothetical protein IPK04_17440 [Bdellovibrionales bacterium]|nr:hypothetical protein [Bdellovibrionales bacterium]
MNTSILRTGKFDNQGSSQPWTWAWTTDAHSFEIWRPNGICLRLDTASSLKIFGFREYTLRAPVSISIGKTGPVSYGLIGLNSDGSTISLIKDTYPFFDANFNSTYDGLFEDEDFYPHQEMGRELASRLKIPFDSQIALWPNDNTQINRRQ